MFCRELAAQVRGVEDRIVQRGAGVTFIGNGNVVMANAFKEDFNVTSPLYTDPSLKVYGLAGMQRGLGSLWKAAKNAPRALAGGHLQGLRRGDGRQQGGVLVVSMSGDLLFEQRSEAAGDHPDLEQVIGALSQAG